MCLIHQSHHNGTLLHCFLCIFHLEDTTLWRAVAGELASDGSEDVELVLQGDGIVVVIVSEHREDGGIRMYGLIIEMPVDKGISRSNTSIRGIIDGGNGGAGAGSKVTRCEALSCCGLRPQYPVTFQAPTSLGHSSFTPIYPLSRLSCSRSMGLSPPIYS